MGKYFTFDFPFSLNIYIDGWLLMFHLYRHGYGDLNYPSITGTCFARDMKIVSVK